MGRDQLRTAEVGEHWNFGLVIILVIALMVGHSSLKPHTNFMQPLSILNLPYVFTCWLL